MTVIDASKSQLLPQLLRKLVIGLTQLSSADIELQQVTTELNLIRGNLSQLPVERAYDALDRASHLAQGYNLSEFKGNDFVTTLPQIIETIKDELDHLVTQAKLLGKAASDLFFMSSQFEQLVKKAK